MTAQNILLIDICGRLPYGLFVKEPNNPYYPLIYTLDYHPHIKNCIPYLRPLSTMTEDEFQDLKNYSGLMYDQLELQEFYDNSKCLEFYLSEIPSYVVILVFDWLNKNMFDYRGLIPSGLADVLDPKFYKNGY